MAKKSSRKGRGELGPWRVDGISAEAVTAANRAAADAGVPLDVWLNRVIRETAQRERALRESPPERSAEN